MCFRPSAVDGSKKNEVQYGECPSCGNPVAANVGITSGTCPYCGNAITTDAPIERSNNLSHNVKII